MRQFSSTKDTKEHKEIRVPSCEFVDQFMDPMIEICDLTFAYAAGHAVFERFTWRVETGEAWAVIGPSGCGKTTLLYLLAGLRLPTSGGICIAGQPLARPRPTTGLILQDYGLLPWATVRENAALGLRLREFYGPDGRHAPPDEIAGVVPNGLVAERVNPWLERLGIAAVADKYPGQISGGQRQRTAIARTLVLRPDLLLMDEPFASLDAPTREDLQNLAVELRAEHKLTTVVVTHNIEDAAFLGERILVLAHPPHRAPVAVKNPRAGQAGYRAQPAFLDKCNELRKLLG
jgi:NitT/TauT family transport system ATP-binding protein